MKTLIYHGEDSALIREFDDIETHNEIVRHIFVTLEPGAENAVWIRSAPLQDLSSFDGPLFQVDYDKERDALILNQVQMRFWPWGHAAETLDELLRHAFDEFYESLSQSSVDCSPRSETASTGSSWAISSRSVLPALR